MWWRIGIQSALFAVLLAENALPSLAQTEKKEPAEERPATLNPNDAHRHEDYTIGPGDVVQIVVWKNEHLSKTIPVRPDGKISLPLLDDIQAAGLTPVQLKDTVANGLRHYIDSPVVTVIISEINNYKVAVLGEVKKPGVYSLKGKTTIVEAISLAEGFTEFASTNNILLVRRSKGQRYRFDYRAYVAGENMEQNVYLDPGDTIIVK